MIKKKVIAQRFQMDLGDELPPYQKAFKQTRRTFGGASSSTDMDASNVQTKRRSKSEGAASTSKRQAVTTDMNVDTTTKGRPKKVMMNEIMTNVKADTKRKEDKEPSQQGKRQNVTKPLPLPSFIKEPDKPEPVPEPVPAPAPRPAKIPPVIKPQAFKKERVQLTPDQVGITGITESFKVAKNKGKYQ